ncbi:MAG: hypothetical protein J5825_10760 [Lachnospiraceae bacterium]|nr:hypothetical protein [Lachnospiraceae bacterium]
MDDYGNIRSIFFRSHAGSDRGRIFKYSDNQGCLYSAVIETLFRELKGQKYSGNRRIFLIAVLACLYFFFLPHL